MADNTFDIEVLPDGKLKVTNQGGFSQEIHADADAFLQLLKDMMGGETQTRKLPPNLSNPHHQHKHDHHHHH